ncbi:MAG: hypothetical protein M3379_04250 [Acidobacteriota bacterium]|nr:hypothetical protein [Acidobacteriota bacterium]
MLPDPKDPQDQFAGGCHECGEPTEYNVEGYSPREREVMAELYGVGSSLATVSASRRSVAALEWLRRQLAKKNVPLLHGLAHALEEETLRRFVKMWEAHLQNVRLVSDDVLEFMASEELQTMPDDDLAAIIWPETESGD